MLTRSSETKVKSRSDAGALLLLLLLFTVSGSMSGMTRQRQKLGTRLMEPTTKKGRVKPPTV